MNNAPLYFATLDPLRGLGMESVHSNFHLVCFDYTAVVDMLTEDGIQVYCLEKEIDTTGLDHTTRTLLTHQKVQEYIEQTSTDTVEIAVFKPTFDLETVLGKTTLGTSRIIAAKNPRASQVKQLENKLNFFEMCNTHNISHTPAYTAMLSEIEFLESPIVIQFERGWFGNRTFFINTTNELTTLQQKYKDRPVLVSNFIDGTVLTNNFVVTQSEILQSYPFLQLNDTSHEEPKLSRLKGSTIGNEWSDLLSIFGSRTESIVETIRTLTENIGKVIQNQGFWGFAGLDFIVTTDGTVYVQELNPRFTASAQMFTQLEKNTFGTSLFEQQFIQVNTHPDTFFTQLNGTRIIARNTQSKTVTIQKIIRNGIYTLHDDDTYTFEKSGYKLSELRENQFLLFTAKEGKQVNPDEEILQVQSFSITSSRAIQLARNIKARLV